MGTHGHYPITDDDGIVVDMHHDCPLGYERGVNDDVIYYICPADSSNGWAECRYCGQLLDSDSQCNCKDSMESEQ